LVENYDWPGNVRELKNFVDSVVVLSAGRPVDVELVREQLIHYQETDDLSSALPMLARKSVDQVERELVYQALLSLGVEIREMKQILLNLDHNMGSQAIHNDAEDIYYQDDVQPIEEMEKQLIKKALLKFHGNKRKAAHALNISERTLYRKLKDYGLQ